jgi:hypothetical protein
MPPELEVPCDDQQDDQDVCDAVSERAAGPVQDHGSKPAPVVAPAYVGWRR